MPRYRLRDHGDHRGVRPSPSPVTSSPQQSSGGGVAPDVYNSAGIGVSWYHCALSCVGARQLSFWMLTSARCRFNDVSTGCYRVAGFTRNSSAAESGMLQPGDVLMDVDGVPATQKSLREVAMLILGPPGTAVTLRVLPVCSSARAPLIQSARIISEQRRQGAGVGLLKRDTD